MLTVLHLLLRAQLLDDLRLLCDLPLEMRLVCPCLPLLVDYLFVLSLQETLRVRSSLQLLTLKSANFQVSQLISLKERLQLGGFISVSRCLMAELRFNVVYFFLELVGTTVS